MRTTRVTPNTLFEAVNVQWADSSKGESMAGFANPKSQEQALREANRVIYNATQHIPASILKNPTKHGPYLFTAVNGRGQVIAWITLTPAKL